MNLFSALLFVVVFVDSNHIIIRLKYIGLHFNDLIEFYDLILKIL